jgi:hypothetical protein
MNVRAAGAILLLTVAAAAEPSCSSAQVTSSGLYGEPIEIANGQFVPGAFPSPGMGSDGGATGPTITSDPVVGPQPNPIYNGEAGVSVAGGTASPDASSIGVRFKTMGTGYWIVPTAGIDTQANDDRDFGMKASFSPSVPAGKQTIEFVAFNAAGQAGPPVDVTACFAPSVPDYTNKAKPFDGHTCNAIEPLPPLVFSMKWDQNFDVDLTVELPDGEIINPKTPFEIPGDGGEDAGPAQTDAFFDRDSLRNCAPDGYRQEDLVFPTPPPSGRYLIYANPFSSCGLPSTEFTLSIWKEEGVCPTCAQVNVFQQSGQLTGTDLFGSQSTGGSTLGLYVTTYNVP